jgi:hypothetical protein
MEDEEKVTDRPTRQQIEELRRKADANLAASEGQPPSQKAVVDLATLEAARAPKH